MAYEMHCSKFVLGYQEVIWKVDYIINSYFVLALTYRIFKIIHTILNNN